jgi:PAS domain S-box-containing protein
MARVGKPLFGFNSIKQNIIFALIASGSVTFLVAFAIFWQVNSLENQYVNSQEQAETIHNSALDISSAIQESSLLLLSYAESNNVEHRKEWQRLWEDVLNPAGESLAQFNAAENNAKLKTVLNQLGPIKILQTSIFEAIPNGGAPIQTEQLVAKNLELQLSLEQVILDQRRKIDAIKASTSSSYTFLKAIGIAGMVIGLMVGIILGTLLIGQIIRSLYHIKQVVKELSNGNLPEKIWQSKNEAGYITRELDRLVANLKNVQEFALQVGGGKFDNKIDVFNGEGDLGSSLLEMRQSLAKVAEEDQQRNWINEGFAKFADILRNNNSDIATLSDITISNLVRYLNANQGAIFLVNDKDDEDPTLSLAACYAYDRKKYLNKEIFKGEGLCGQAWQENDLILINDVPDDYVQIRSGLGKANPRSILVMPLSVNDKTQGILEVASFNEFKPYQVEFVKKIAENFASAISTARNNEHTKSLLAEFQEMTEELRAQEEEMRQNMEELKATQEEMERARTETELKEQNLNSVINNTTDTIFAIDCDYKILVANKVLSDKYSKMGVSLQIGTCIKDILPKAAWDKWKQRYDRALAGEQYSLIEESSGSNGSRFSQTYHNPIRDESGTVIGVSVISRDVTEIEMARREVENRRATLRSFIDNTTDTFFAIDTEYKILLANSVLKDRFASSNITLDEGENIFDKLPKAQHTLWKERYDRALAGESFMLEEERKVKDDTLYIEVHVNPITDENGQVLGVTVISKDITRWKRALDMQEQKENELNKLKTSLGMADPKELLLRKAANRRPVSKS